MGRRPIGLPSLNRKAISRGVSAFEKARICPHCKSGKGVRIISNQYGVRAVCGPCKKHWPISAAPLSSEIPITVPKGFRKETLVEPNWEKAYDEISGDVTNEQVGPKKR